MRNVYETEVLPTFVFYYREQEEHPNPIYPGCKEVAGGASLT